jgi:hypothetical protein
MIDRKTAKWLTIAGALAAVLSGLGSLLIAFLPSFNPLGFGEALLILGLAVGIFLNNRACAVAALLFFAVMRFEMYSDAAAAQALHGSSVMIGFVLSALFFTFLYVLGVVGTFATASLPPATPRTADESSFGGISPAPVKKKVRVKAESARGICGACNGLGQMAETNQPCAWCDGKGYV